jgi:hypothetical protein
VIISEGLFEFNHIWDPALFNKRDKSMFDATSFACLTNLAGVPDARLFMVRTEKVIEFHNPGQFSGNEQFASFGKKGG